MSIVWEMAKNETKSNQIAKLLLKFDEVLGLELKKSEKYIEEKQNVKIPKEIEELAKIRLEAKLNKDYKKSDEIRDEIIAKGYLIKDLPNEKYEITKA